MDEISTKEIQDIARTLFNRESMEDRANQCGRFTSIIEYELEDRGIEFDTIYNGSISHNGETARHSFILISAGQLTDISDGPVIIDPTVHQFSIGNVQNENIDVQVNLEEHFSLPTTREIGVYSPKDKIYQVYSTD